MEKLKIGAEEYHVRIGNYPTAKLAMFIQLIDADGCPYMTLSKNFGNFSYVNEMMPFMNTFVQKDSTFIDINNLHTDPNEIMSQLGAKPYMRWGSPVHMESGWCQYPLWEFDPAILREFDPDGYDRYVKAWAEEFPKQQAELNKEMFGDTDEEEDAYEE